MEIEGIRRLRLSRPERGNALDMVSVSALSEGIAEAVADPGVRLLVLTGEGRNFCTGFDLDGLEAQSDGDLLLRFVRIEQMLQAIRHAPVPCVALAQGRVFGAGADLFAACAWRIATPEARFAFPGARFGLVLGTARLAALVGAQAALDATSRGQILPAARALELGLATELAEPAGWDAAVAGILAEVSATPRATLAALWSAALPDTRDADLAALVRSAASPGLGARIAAYRAASR